MGMNLEGQISKSSHLGMTINYRAHTNQSLVQQPMRRTFFGLGDSKELYDQGTKLYARNLAGTHLHKVSNMCWSAQYNSKTQRKDRSKAPAWGNEARITRTVPSTKKWKLVWCYQGFNLLLNPITRNLPSIWGYIGLSINSRDCSNSQTIKAMSKDLETSTSRALMLGGWTDQPKQSLAIWNNMLQSHMQRNNKPFNDSTQAHQKSIYRKKSKHKDQVHQQVLMKKTGKDG
jgi:hypothetical protein